jgi:hypothetical protein
MGKQSDNCSHMFKLIGEWQRSGLTQTAWCQSQDIAYSRFHYWYKRFREQSNTSGSPVISQSSFISLEVKPVVSDGALCYAEVLCPDGRRILFHQGVDAGYLKSLLW